MRHNNFRNPIGTGTNGIPQRSAPFMPSEVYAQFVGCSTEQCVGQGHTLG